MYKLQNSPYPSFFLRLSFKKVMDETSRKTKMQLDEIEGQFITAFESSPTI